MLRRAVSLVVGILLGIIVEGGHSSAQMIDIFGSIEFGVGRGTTLTLNFNPSNPSVPANAPLGTVVATINPTWSDGSPFTGTLSFAKPYSNDEGVFAISGSNLIINPAGPGLSADANTVQNVSIVATQ